MARTVKDASLDTRAARGRLKPRGKPYFRVIEPGVHLGYRKPLSGPGRWVLRHYVGDEKYVVETFDGSADDYSDADGVAVLNFAQAQAAVRDRMVTRAHALAGNTGPITVSAALKSYIGYLRSAKESADEAQYTADAFINPALGDIEVASLTTDQIRDWHALLADTPARIRTRPGEPQRFKDDEDDDPDEVQRRRRSTANRKLTVLKAALNRLFEDGKVQSDVAWRRVKPFEGVDAARVRYLTIAESSRLLNGCDPDFRRLVRGALETGARYGELCRLQVCDFNPDSKTLAIRKAKSKKARHIVLTDEGAAFFAVIVTGRAGTDPMFVKENGERWERSHQADPMAVANTRGTIDPPINFHGLRHTWASHAVMNGVPLLVVAKNLGHTDTRMVEKHYGHLAQTYVTEAIRAGAPRFGDIAVNNVTPIGHR